MHQDDAIDDVLIDLWVEAALRLLKDEAQVKTPDTDDIDDSQP
jgi:hypothetical protein